jgi:hypothetical protein
MCERARLSADYSETRIKLKFDLDYPAPNIPAQKIGNVRNKDREVASPETIEDPL